MKNYGKKVLSVMLALVMCLSVFAVLDFSKLTAGAYTASPTHTYQVRVNRVSRSDNYDGQDNGGTCTLYGKDKNGTGTQSQIWSGSIGTGWATVDGGATDICTLTSDKWPTRIYIGCNICKNNSMFYDSQRVTSKIEVRVMNAATGSYGDWMNLGQFDLYSDTTSGGGGSSFKSATFDLNTTGRPAATKVATSNSEANGATTTYNVTLNATGGAAKTQAMNAYVYDQYNVIWTAAPKSWSKEGNVAGATSLSTTGASESCTLTMNATSSTYQKATVTVSAKYDTLVHYFKYNITPTYKITYNISGNGGTSAVPGPDNTANNNTGSVNVTYTIPSGTNYTAKKEKGSSSTGTWTFVGWNGSQSATSGTKPGGSITIDNYNDTLYAIFSKTATATFYWYNSSGQRTSSTNTKTVYNNATQYTFDVPKSSVPATFTVNGTTYTFAGWAVDSSSKTTADVAASATTSARSIKNGNLTDTYTFYALYTGSVTLSYNNNGGSGQPASQTANLTLNCGGNTSAANNTSGRATFTVNPNNVTMTRQYASDFVGWNDTQKDDETAQYKDGTVTWAASSALPTTITIAKDTTLYASFYDFRYNVKFFDYKGTQLSNQPIRYNRSATAPTMKTNSADPSHKDANSHYVFDHWEYADGSAYADSQKLVNATNGYTFNVYAKYIGHKHIWGDPYNIQGAVTCTTGQTYKMKCTVCGYVRDFESDPLGHDYILTGVAEPTCTKPGSYGKLICANCGAIDPNQTAMINGVETLITDENRVIPALGHDYGDVDIDHLTDDEGNFIVEPITVAATCTTAGYYYYECARCGETFRVGNIPATGHDWDVHEKIEPTCTEKGHKAYTKCLNCGLFLDGADEDIPALGHDYVLVEETASTCTVAGHYAYYECSRCGKLFKLENEAYVEIDDASVMDKPLADHDYQFVDHVDATCTEPGYTGAWLCSVCGQLKPGTEPGTSTEALGHDFGDWEVVTPATCAAPGEKKRECRREGCGFAETEEIPALAHTQGEYIPPVAATCLAEGSTEGYYCANCDGYYLEPTVVAKIPHEMETVAGTAPTCTEDGIPDCYRCTLCEKLYLDAEGKREVTGEVGTIPALGHNFTDWVVAKQPTEDEAGRETRKCLRCGLVENKEISALGHELTAVEAKAATCTEDGIIACYTCVNCGKYYADAEAAQPLDYETEVRIAALGHDIDEANPDESVAATCAADGYNKFVCGRCGHTVIVTLPRIAEHGAAVPYGENRDATCAEPGQTAGTMCSICGEVLTQPTAIPKLPHTPEADRRDVRAATCTETGFTGDLYCSACGQKLEGGTVIEAKGHTLGALTEISAATCTDYGEKRRTCADCDYCESYETPVLGHQIVIDKAVPATCEAAGLTEGKHCSRCGAVLVAQEEISALGHAYEAEVIEPTCTKIGKTVHTCINCGDTYEDNFTEKTDHVVGTPATCTDAAICANCGRSFGAALGHDYQIDSSACTESTCIAHGATVYKCTRCSATYSEERPFADHRYDESTLTPHFTSCTEPGYFTIECSVCHYVYREEAPAPGHNYVNGFCTQCGAPEPSSTPDTPAAPVSEKCEKCGLNHNGRTGLWKQDGIICKILAFFRNIFKMFSR